MAQRVRTMYFSQFQMPDICVSCGAPAEPGLYHRIDKTQSNWSGKRYTTLNLNFPVCAECHAVSANRGGAKAVDVIGVILALLVCLLSGAVASASSDNNILITIAAALIGAFLTSLFFGWISRLINEKGFTQEQKLRRRNLFKAGTLTQFKEPGMFDKQGLIEFKFENLPFATSFALLNNGSLV